jgi:hypothetical protein
VLEKLKQRRKILESQREQLAANLHVTAGAIQVLDELIAEIELAPSDKSEAEAATS